MAELLASRTSANILSASVARMQDEGALATREFLTALQSLPKFIRDIARTVDEHDTTMVGGGGRTVPGKPFPEWQYLYDVIGEYEEHRLLLVEKARQLMLTWLFAAIVVWEVRRQPGQRWGWTSIKAGTADAALGRMWDVITRLPGRTERSALGHTGFRDAGGVLWTRAEGRISIPSMSSNIHALSQNSSDARSYTYSGILMDEMAFLPWAREAYAAIKPTIDTGRFVAITTPGPFGWVHQLYTGKNFGLEDA